MSPITNQSPSELRRIVERLPGLPLAGVSISYADELVLELGRLVPRHQGAGRQVGEWRLGSLGASWHLAGEAGELLFPVRLDCDEAWPARAVRAFDVLLGAAIAELEHTEDWRLVVRFEAGHELTIEPASDVLPDWQLTTPDDGPCVEGGPGHRLALLSAYGRPPIELADEPLGLIG